MKKMLLIFALCLAPVTAHAEDKVIPLEGNAELHLNSNNGRYVYHGYDTDDLIYRRIINPYARPRETVRHFPKNDYSAICGDVERASQRRRCREDVMDLDKDRQDLYNKYN